MMPAGETIGFAVAWVALAGVLVWSIVRTPPVTRPGRAATNRRPVDIDLTTVLARPAGSERWVSLETLDGSGPDVVALGEMLVAAALAARGLDVALLDDGDVRVEVVDDIDGSQVTRFMVRTRLLSRPRTS